MLKRILKAILPNWVLLTYHFCLALLASILYGDPSNKLMVIGVTGTNGKSSTVQFIAQLLEGLGETVGYTTTAGFSIAGEEIENRLKMTMPGRFLLQRMLARMVKAGCNYAIVETSSEGLIQYRHIGINYDMAVFTNLTPEHIERHGSFEAYKAAKGLLFSHLTKRKRKTLQGKTVPKRIVLNASSEHAEFYGQFRSDESFHFSVLGEAADLQLNILKRTTKGTTISLNGITCEVPLIGDFQLFNVTAAVAALMSSGLELERIAPLLSSIRPIPGRLEIVHKEPLIIIDYAYEPYALQALFASICPLKAARIIGIHGSAGGGRDKARRPKIGSLAAKEEDIVIITNEDPYDEPPRSIIEDVADGARAEGMKEGENLFLINERMDAIEKAIDLANPEDIILVTGKGNETVIAGPHGKKISWNDKEAILEALNTHRHE
jgi:UDP-N-acetylmuramoyl-L-alanyl-D-glutamate--2,6-diaminopimelate ligase